MFSKLLCKNDCKQATVYVVAQSVWILLYLGFILAILNKTKVSGQLIFPLIMMIVFTVLFYHLITYLCEKQYGNIAWIIAILPYISAMVWGYHIVPLLVGCMAQNKYTGL
jgi:hypothetical protein